MRSLCLTGTPWAVTQPVFSQLFAHTVIALIAYMESVTTKTGPVQSEPSASSKARSTATSSAR
jgi:hypothetical protein